MSGIRAMTNTGLDQPTIASWTPEHQPAWTSALDADYRVWPTRSGNPRAIRQSDVSSDWIAWPAVPLRSGCSVALAEVASHLWWRGSRCGRRRAEGDSSLIRPRAAGHDLTAGVEDGREGGGSEAVRWRLDVPSGQQVRDDRVDGAVPAQPAGRDGAGGCGLLPARRVVVSPVHSHLNS
jgi:hypothetical protein